ncbi:unnamed protein product [[Actinomadura] parvosata subsp. kistnae]|uniref:Uncharacterized protein n=1 Tax=[Actinomadura] parvosata subsp. kistnae TaxID=1909395 RepID=A0A1V0AE56_9ACTN|nr:hypothetical protein [Nonomuraea sp. ATCC 55076]AQZ68459.1 hypothetical protein BKM31_49565 [Nonomuraea sp. ATCC 55076]SPL93093.1 unnamed protein product [Actinomadura parvosata subsp. kistnae]
MKAWRIGTILLAILLTIVYLVYLAGIPLGLVTHRLEVHEVALAAALLAGVWFAASSYSITDFSIGAGGVSARLDRTEARQRVLESELRALQVALSGLVTKYEWDHLRRLAGEGPVPARFRQDGKLQLELERLDAMAFVEPVDTQRGLNAIREDHGHTYEEFDLTRYVRITKAGREYLRLREKL